MNTISFTLHCSKVKKISETILNKNGIIVQFITVWVQLRKLELHFPSNLNYPKTIVVTTWETLIAEVNLVTFHTF